MNEGRQARRLTNEELLATAEGYEPEAYAVTEHIQIAASRELTTAAPRERLDELGVRIMEFGKSVAFLAPGVPHVMFNRAELGAREDQLNLGEVDAILEAFRTSGIESFLLQVPPRASNQATERALVERRLVRYRRPWVKLLRGAEPPAEVTCEFEISEVGPGEAELVGHMIVEGFGFPASAADLYAPLVGRTGWRAYLAREAGEPAALGLAYVEGKACYLAGGVTRPRFRRRSAQRALMQQRIVDAIAMGATAIATETGLPLASEENPSYRNMIHWGFRAVGTRDNYGPAGTKW